MDQIDLETATKLAAERIWLALWPIGVEAQYQRVQRTKHRYLRMAVFIIIAMIYGLGMNIGLAVVIQPQASIVEALTWSLRVFGTGLAITAALLALRPQHRVTIALQYGAALAIAIVGLSMQYLAASGLLVFPPILVVSTALPLVIFCGYPAISVIVGLVVTFCVSAAIEFTDWRHPELVAAKVYALSIIGLTLIGAAVVLDYLGRLAWVNIKLARLLGSTDSLTGLSTRAQFNQNISNRLRQARRDRIGIAILLLDIDHFKRINDVYGHIVGDQVLSKLGRMLLQPRIADRPNDLTVRFGGEEILILWYGIAPAPLAAKIETMMKNIRALEFVTAPDLPPIKLTASAGVIHLTPETELDPLQLLSDVDALLYQAKSEGRDRVVALER